MASLQGCAQSGYENLSKQKKLPARCPSQPGPLEIPVLTLHCPPVPRSFLMPGPCPQSALCTQQISLASSSHIHLSGKYTEPDSVLGTGIQD